MRIVGGKYKGLIFNPGKTFKARPTTDIAKEALFNILVNRYSFEECDVLDLFSGTGSIGYEFLSREAKSVTMVELNYKHVTFIKSTLASMKEKAVVLTSDAFRYVQLNKHKYDIVFADPPYDHPHFSQIVDMVVNADMVNENGVFIIEHSKMYDFSQLPHFSETRKYGHVNFSFFSF